MNYVEKGFKVKGFTIGEFLEGGMIGGVDNSDIPIADIAILRDEPTGVASMSEELNIDGVVDDILGLKEYKDSKNIDWLNSSDYK